MEGLSARAAAGEPLSRLASVASFFLSRIDSAVDKLLDGLAAHGQPAARTPARQGGDRQAPVARTKFTRR